MTTIHGMDYKYEQIACKPIQNINGQYVTLRINKFQCGYEITLTASWWDSFQTKVLLLLLFSMIAILDYTLEVYNWYHFVILFVVLLVLMNQIITTLKSETLLVVKNVGYQIEECYVFGKQKRFIEWNTIESVFINEVISMQRILFILTVKTCAQDTNSKLFPLFQVTKPRLNDIKEMYRLLQTV